MPHDFPRYIVPGLPYGSCTYCGSPYPGTSECPSPTAHEPRQHAIYDAKVISARIAELYAERTAALNTPTIVAAVVDDFYDGCG